MTTRKAKAHKIGRDARTGQFIPVAEAKKRPNTTVIETIKKKKQALQSVFRRRHQGYVVVTD